MEERKPISETEHRSIELTQSQQVRDNRLRGKGASGTTTKDITFIILESLVGRDSSIMNK